MGSKLEDVLKRNSELEAEVKELRERVLQQFWSELETESNCQVLEHVCSLPFQQVFGEPSTGPVIKCGYLYKHRTRFLERPWELRFFSLTRNTLSFWKSEAEAVSHPRGRHLVDNWVIHSEGLRNGKFVTFSIEDSSGTTILSLSEGKNAEGGSSWMNALKSVTAMNGGEQHTSVREQHISESVKPSTSEGEITSGITQDLVQDDARSDLVADSHLRRRKSKLADLPSTGNTVLLQEGRPKNEAERKTDRTFQYTLRPSAPAHKRLRESPLSSDAIFSQSHAGLFNLCIVCLVAINGRLIIENLMKYGLLMQTGFWFSSKSLKDWPLLMVGFSLPLFPVCSFFVERLAAHSSVPEKVVVFFHVVITTASILYPSYSIHRFNSALLSGFVLTMISIVEWMKLISYAHANADARALARKGEKVGGLPEDTPYVEYPANLTASDISYFMLAPTLCYQIGYPRTKTIRKGWVLRQVVKLLVFTGLMGFIIEQYINPTIKNSTHPLKGSYLKALERVLKLSIPTLYVWLCMFYCFFHLWLNILAELMRFGDREFYKDWWNAKTIEEYWRMWNMPVHRWMVRHVYFPCLRTGMPKHVAVLVVFALSGVFHEVFVGIPCHMLRCWAFLGIMFQVPLVFLTNYLQRRFKNLMLGNMVFWFFFCIVGQPMCVLLYYHDVVNQQQPHRSGRIRSNASGEL